MFQLSDNAKGALLMAASMTAFTVNDGFMKALSDELPLFQALTLRGLGVVLVLAILCTWMGQFRYRCSRSDWKLILGRAVAECAGAVCFLTALFNMPIANVSAILQVLPLSVTLAGAIFLGEALGWRRVGAILIGFVGVLLIVQPGGADFNTYSLVALAAVAMVTIRDLAARQLAAEVPTILVALITATFVTCVVGVVSLFVTWQPISRLAGMQLSLSALTIIGGYVFSISAMRIGDIGAVAPFRYTSLLVALLIGYFVFNELPNALSLTGAAIVVAMGLFTIWREARLQRQ